MATTEQDTKGKASTRTYVVLARNDDMWDEIGMAEASTDQQAIAKVTAADAAGTWVAVPQRSWHPRTRELEPQPPKAVWS
jgi:hypothetical protein